MQPTHPVENDYVLVVVVVVVVVTAAAVVAFVTVGASLISALLLNGFASAAGPSFQHRSAGDLVAWKLGCSDARWMGGLVPKTTTCGACWHLVSPETTI